MRSRVCTEKDPVLVFVEEFVGRSRLAAEFADARRDIDEHVRVAVKVVRNVLQILSEIPNVQHNELRSGMPRHNTIARRQQLFVIGKVAAVKRPIGMIVQLFVALVEAVRRSKERNRVRNVNGHRNIELCTGIPHGIKACVVNSHEGPGCDVLPQVESERLQNLQPTCSVTMRLLDGLGLQLWIVPRVRGLGKGVEPSGISAVISHHGFGESFFVSARQVDHGTNVLSLHHRQ